MKKLPDHTTRYFAAQDYWIATHTGSKGPWKHKTVQGVELTVEYDRENNAMICTYPVEGEEPPMKKVHRCAKSWAY